MFFSDRVELRAVVYGTDADGYTTTTTTDTEVWADVRSATRAEFYAANAVGIEVGLMITVHAEDYNNQTQVIYNDTVYDIVRAFRKGLGLFELTCKAV